MAPSSTSTTSNRFETVAGYCWPQSVAPGGTVTLHLSSPRGLPVAVEVARIGADRTVVFDRPGRAGRLITRPHPTPPPTAATGRRP